MPKEVYNFLGSANSEPRVLTCKGGLRQGGYRCIYIHLGLRRPNSSGSKQNIVLYLIRSNYDAEKLGFTVNKPRLIDIYMEHQHGAACCSCYSYSVQLHRVTMASRVAGAVCLFQVNIYQAWFIHCESQLFCIIIASYKILAAFKKKCSETKVS